MRVERLADLRLEPADLPDQHLEGVREAQDDRAASAGLDLAGATRRCGPQPLEQLRRVLRAEYPCALRNAAIRFSPSPRASSGLG